VSKTDVASTARDLRISVGRISRRLRQLYAAHTEDGGLLFLELAVLSRLARHGPASPSTLANNERVTAQAIGPVVTSLHQRGLATRTPDPSDGRKVIVAITDAGHAALGAREHAIVDRLADTLRDGFTAQQLNQLAAVMPLLDKLADQL
jgi:DNA-binding MarR family transcriptional regulator